MTAASPRLGRRLTGLALVIASLAVAGCGTPGAAVVAGGRRVSVGDLQKATLELQDIAGQQGQINQLQVLDWLVVEPWAVDIAAKYHVGVSTDDAENLIQQANPAYDPESTTTPHKVASAQTVAAVRGMLALRHLQGQGVQLNPAAAQQAIGELQAKVKATEIEVNPRYLGTPMDWLAGGQTPAPGSEPAPAPAPAPQPVP